MKNILLIIILLIISAKSIAGVRLEMIPNDPSYVSMQIEAADEAAAKEELKKVLEKSEFLKGQWKDTEAGSIMSREVEVMEGEDPRTEYYLPSNFSINIVDTTEEEQEKALEAAINQKIDCGNESVKFIAKNNVKKNLTKTQIKEMSQTYSLIFDLLKGGAIDTAIEEINGITPDGVILTYQDKTAILNYIQGCNN